MLRPFITGSDLGDIYKVQFSDIWQGKDSWTSPNALLMSATFNSGTFDKISADNISTLKIDNYAIAMIGVGYGTISSIQTDYIHLYEKDIYSTTANKACFCYCGYLTSIEKAAFSRLKHDILYGVKEINNAYTVVGLQEATGNISKDFITDILDTDERYSEAHKHLTLYMTFLQHSSQGGDNFKTLAEHHLKQYVDCLRVANESYLLYLNSIGIGSTQSKSVTTIGLYRI